MIDIATVSTEKLPAWLITGCDFAEGRRREQLAVNLVGDLLPTARFTYSRTEVDPAMV